MRYRIACIAALASLLFVPPALAMPLTLYYDTNGATGGTATSSTQNFTDTVWTIDPTGASATTGYTAGSDIVFSATDGINVGTGTQSVTVTDTESADGFTFDNGIVTLYGSGSPNLSIGAGGITVNSTDGATTFDSSLGTLTLSASQSWDNDSTKALNVNSTVNGNGQTLTFDGTGTGNVNLNGVLSGSLNLTEDSASSPAYLNVGNNNFSGTVTVNGGTLVAAYGGSLAGNVLDLSNGGLLVFANGTNFNDTINLGTGGGQLNASLSENGSGDNEYGGVMTGTSLTLVGGDLITTTNALSSIGTINITGGRLLSYANGIYGSGTTTALNVDSGGTLDFAVEGTTLGNTVTLADGSYLEARASNITLSDVLFPTNGTVTIGSDDYVPGSIDITDGFSLGGTLTLDIRANNDGVTPVYLDGNISGTGALTLTGVQGGVLHLDGNSSYGGTTTLNNLTVYDSNSGFGTSSITSNNSTVVLAGGTLGDSFTASTGTSYLDMTSGVQSLSSSFLNVSSGAELVVSPSGTAQLTISGAVDVAASGATLLLAPGGSSQLTISGPLSVASGAALDFAWNGTGATLANTVTLAEGSTLENRNTDMIFDYVALPSTGTVTLGSDNVGGGSLTINNDIALTGALTLDVNANGGNGTTVNLAGHISGAGSLTINPGPSGNSLLELSGNNNYTGPTTLNGVTVESSSTGFGTSVVTANSSAIDLTGGTLANSIIANTGYTGINLVANADATVSGPMELSGNGGSLYFANYTASNNLTVGSINFGTTGGGRDVFFNDASTGMIILDGNYTSAGSNAETESGSTIVFGSNGNSNGNYEIGPGANFANFETNGFWYGQATITLDAGNLYIDNSSFIGSQVFGASNGYAGANQTYDLVGSQDILAQLYIDDKHGPAAFGSFTVNQSTADDSVWAGAITMDSTQMVVSAVDGGRLDITGVVQGSSPLGLIKTGAGVVVFDNPNGNTFGVSSAPDSVSPGVTSPVAIDIQQGTLLVNNSQGYGLGNNGGTVNIEKGAIFGGSGNIDPYQTVIAEDPTSVISPGDAGQANLGIAPAIGTLTLQGVTPGATAGQYALIANNGLTLNFKLSGEGLGTLDGYPATTPGVSNDLLTIGGGGMTLSGPIVINLTAVGNVPLLADTVYTLLLDYGNWDGTPTSITVNAPTGYALDPDFGPPDALGDGYDQGYVYDNTPDSGGIYVELIQTPEPSTYGLLGLGLLALVAIGRFRRLDRV